MTWEVDFSIGPVQGFVAQSRRTRDLWGSSYLLSYLAARAMSGAADHGEIVRPRVDDDPLFGWVRGGRAGLPPRIGSVPNHFVVRSDAGPEEVVAAAEAAFYDAWRQVYQAVWDRYLRPVRELGNQTERIWRRQVEGFWEVTWVAGEGGSHGLLARRKHWRTHRLPEEPGDKCTVMPDFQELSGHVRGAGGRAAQQRFWDELRGRVGTVELRDDESLCAIAFIKRFFAKIGKQTIGGELDVDNWPSTLYVGAVPWLREVRDSAAAEAKEYVTALSGVAIDGTIRRRVPLAEFAGGEPSEFFRLDANYYHPGFLASERLAPLRGDGGDRARAELVDLLRKVNGSVGSAAPVYYAFLLADGDRLGEQVARAGGDAGKVSAALSAFGREVDGIVRKYHGVTVYAGGDDVLAMLPVPDALRCADELARAYAAAFQKAIGQEATLSAAVVFAHVRMPVGGALAHARDLLERVAKDGNGRDSLAVAVLKPGGPHCQWVTTWTRRYPDSQEPVRAVQPLYELAGVLGDKDGGRGFSASLLHHVRDTLTLLCGQPDWSPGRFGELPEGLDLAAFIRAEVVDSWERRQPAPGEAAAGHAGDDDPEPADLARVTRLVVDLLPPSVNRRGEGSGSATVDMTHAGVDGLLLARFVAGGGREEDHG